MLRDAFLLHIRRMLAIVRKELLVLFCNPISRMLLIVPPLMQIIVFGWAATMEVRNVDVAVLDHDEGPLSREIVRRLEGSPTFRHVFFLRGQQEVRPAIEQEKALFVMVFDAEFSRRAARGEPVTVQLLLDGVVDYLPAPNEVVNKALDMDDNEKEVVLSNKMKDNLAALAFQPEESKYGQLT